MTQASNRSVLFACEEETLRNLPASRTWRPHEVNTYSTFGGAITTIARDPINEAGQDLKGTVVDVESTAAYEIDFTRGNVRRELQGFFRADADDPVCTNPVAGDWDGSATIVITSVSATEYVAAAGLGVFLPDMLIWAENFGTANDGLRLVTAADATGIEAAGLVAQASVPADAQITCVGKQFASGDVAVAISGGIISLESTLGDFADLDVEPGEWLAVGGDAALTFLAACPRFFMRVRTKTDDTIVADHIHAPAGAVVADAGAGRTLQVFIGGKLKNPVNPDDLVRRTYTLERQFKRPGLTQAEYVKGAIPNTFMFKMQGQQKLTADVGYIGCDTYYRNGSVGFEIETGTREVVPGEEAFSTAADYRFGLVTITDPSASEHEALFAFATDMTLGIDLQNTPDKALGTVGAIDAQGGNFKVAGTVTAFFETVDALESIRRNFDVAVTVGFFTTRQYGFILDLPLCQLEGELDVAKNTSTKMPLNIKGCMNKFGHTLMYNYFAYIPAAWVQAY